MKFYIQLDMNKNWCLLNFGGNCSDFSSPFSRVFGIARTQLMLFGVTQNLTCKILMICNDTNAFVCILHIFIVCMQIWCILFKHYTKGSVKMLFFFFFHFMRLSELSFSEIMQTFMYKIIIRRQCVNFFQLKCSLAAANQIFIFKRDITLC